MLVGARGGRVTSDRHSDFICLDSAGVWNLLGSSHSRKEFVVEFASVRKLKYLGTAAYGLYPTKRGFEPHAAWELMIENTRNKNAVFIM